MGRFALGNWPGITNKIIGFLALLVILIGARMTVWTETKQQEYSKNLRSAVLLLLVVNWLLAIFCCTSSNGYWWF